MPDYIHDLYQAANQLLKVECKKKNQILKWLILQKEITNVIFLMKELAWTWCCWTRSAMLWLRWLSNIIAVVLVVRVYKCYRTWSSHLNSSRRHYDDNSPCIQSIKESLQVKALFLFELAYWFYYLKIKLLSLRQFTEDVWIWTGALKTQPLYKLMYKQSRRNLQSRIF